MDSISEQRLTLVAPGLAAKIHQMTDILEPQGVVFRVTQGVRSMAEQAAIYAQGRTTPGVIVTNAPPGHSWHEFGMAVDIVPMDQDPPRPDWNTAHPVWRQIIECGESIGLYSGDEFHVKKDEPHFQLTGSFPVSPNDDVRALLVDQGMEAVWQAAGVAA